MRKVIKVKEQLFHITVKVKILSNTNNLIKCITTIDLFYSFFKKQDEHFDQPVLKHGIQTGSATQCFIDLHM